MACRSCQNHGDRQPYPTDQCVFCAQKHMDEAWMCLNEYKYTVGNLRYVRGAFRAIVLHTYQKWPEMADLARECFLAVQTGEALDGEAMADGFAAKAEALADMIDRKVKETMDG